ncbi:MAG: recombinase family protein [bacterium]|nr:recombinase family protein [bacterium]
MLPARRYALVDRARSLGWRPEQVHVVDEDLGGSGASTEGRTGFARVTTEVAMGKVGSLLGMEASRLTRDTSEWSRLIEICALSLNEDGVYDPGHFNDGLLLGLLCDAQDSGW